MALTERQLRFVEAMLVYDTAKAAAIAAGYAQKHAEKEASGLLARQEIQDAVAKLRAERSERTAITADSVLRRLDAVANRCMQAEPVLDKDGNPTGEYRFEAAGANKALELLGKHLGLFREKVEHSGPNGGPIEVSDAHARLADLVARASRTPASGGDRPAHP